MFCNFYLPANKYRATDPIKEILQSESKLQVKVYELRWKIYTSLFKYLLFKERSKQKPETMLIKQIQQLTNESPTILLLLFPKRSLIIARPSPEAAFFLPIMSLANKNV